TDQFGEYQAEITRRQEVVDVYEAVIVTAQFEQSPLDMRVVFDSERRIAGLFFQPASATETGDATEDGWAPPSYAMDVTWTDVTVGEFELPGTLTTPVGAGPWPAVVLVHGSGPNDRDESIGPNKPFRDVALGLASEGIAVLTYDKRTLARPSDLPADLTVAEEVVDDAVAAVALLRADRTVAIPDQVYVLGHSLGGMLAPRIAGESDGVAGLVLMAAPARPLEDLVLEQTTYLAERDGTVTAEEESALAEVAAQVEAVRDLEEGAGEVLGAPASYWLDLRDYRPAEVAAGLDLPMLVLQGERDYQVTMTDFGMWEEALGSRPDVEFRSFPELNHLMMPGEGEGLSVPEDYEVAGHVAPEVVDAIAAFILGE
ncbi:MAG: alpha/beta fold hydrolase, partial [Actinobacteria bacterium]|nr:alpha/beta fold hydrolase [Actinomycetota bacterium]